MSLRGFEGSYFVHFAKVLCGCSISNLVGLVGAHHALAKGWAVLLLFGAQCRDELLTSNGGYIPSCKRLSPPYRYLHQASLNNHNWEHRNPLLQGKTGANWLLSHARCTFRKCVGFVFSWWLVFVRLAVVVVCVLGFFSVLFVCFWVVNETWGCIYLFIFLNCSPSLVMLPWEMDPMQKHTPPFWLRWRAAAEHLFQSLILSQSMPAAQTTGCCNSSTG